MRVRPRCRFARASSEQSFGSRTALQQSEKAIERKKQKITIRNAIAAFGIDFPPQRALRFRTERKHRPIRANSQHNPR